MTSQLSFLAAEAHREDLLRAAMNSRRAGELRERTRLGVADWMRGSVRVLLRRSRVPARVDAASNAGVGAA